MTSFASKLLAAAAGAGVLLGFTLTASADIACSRNVCWHVQERYEFPAHARVIIHPEGWHWGPREHFMFREHEGHGFWRGSHWTEF
jgi:hypothetical protein